MDSQPLDHQGSPPVFFFFFNLLDIIVISVVIKHKSMNMWTSGLFDFSACYTAIRTAWILAWFSSWSGWPFAHFPILRWRAAGFHLTLLLVRVELLSTSKNIVSTFLQKIPPGLSPLSQKLSITTCRHGHSLEQLRSKWLTGTPMCSAMGTCFGPFLKLPLQF